MHKVSIVIPCYNDFKYIEESVNSAFNQTYALKEIIVVDDGSNRKTKELIKKLSPKIDRIIHQDNGGPSKARDTGINASNGEFILVLDSDDFFEKSFVEKAVNVLINNDDAKLVTSWYNRILNGKVIDVIRPEGGGISKFICYNAATGSAIFREKDWAKCNGYDSQMKSGFEDWEFYIRLLETGGEAVIITENLFNYRLRPNSRTANANKEKYNLMRYIYKKHRDLYLIYHDEIVDHLLNRLQIVESNEYKLSQSIEYKLGLFLIVPFRKLKDIFSR